MIGPCGQSHCDGSECCCLCGSACASILPGDNCTHGTVPCSDYVPGLLYYAWLAASAYVADKRNKMARTNCCLDCAKDCSMRFNSYHGSWTCTAYAEDTLLKASSEAHVRLQECAGIYCGVSQPGGPQQGVLAEVLAERPIVVLGTPRDVAEGLQEE